MLEFSYLCFLLFLLIFILCIGKNNLTLSPKKIKVFINLLLIPLILKYCTLLISFFIEKQQFMYYLKYFHYINYFSIPLAIIVSVYIFLRNEKIKFNHMYIFIAIFGCIYLFIIKRYLLNINVDSSFGYLILIADSIIPNLIYLIFIASTFIYTLINFDKPYSNKMGIKLLLITLIIYLVEYILFLGGIKLYPYPIIGEGLVLVILFRAIYTFNVPSHK